MFRIVVSKIKELIEGAKHVVSFARKGEGSLTTSALFYVMSMVSSVVNTRVALAFFVIATSILLLKYLKLLRYALYFALVVAVYVLLAEAIPCLKVEPLYSCFITLLESLRDYVVALYRKVGGAPVEGIYNATNSTG